MQQPLAQEVPEAPSLGAWQAGLGKYSRSILVLLQASCSAYSQPACSATWTFLSAAVSIFWYLSQQICDTEHILICCWWCPYSELLKVLQIKYFHYPLFWNLCASDWKTQSTQELRFSSIDSHGSRHLKFCWGLSTLHIWTLLLRAAMRACLYFEERAGEGKHFVLFPPSAIWEAGHRDTDFPGLSHSFHLQGEFWKSRNPELLLSQRSLSISASLCKFLARQKQAAVSGQLTTQVKLAVMFGIRTKSPLDA